jgi:hypothetical protein
MPTGTKTWVAPTGHRTVLQLNLVKYQVSLYYLGHGRMRRNGDYRCRFELERNQAALTAFPALIPNRVRGETPGDADTRAATPAPTGDSSNPSTDETYRVMIHDNHGHRLSDDSKVKQYHDNNWMRDVEPALPFRIVVRRLIGNTPTALSGNEALVIEVKDPLEELSQNPLPRRNFFQQFFNHFNQPHASPDAGEDNADTTFGGARDTAAPRPGTHTGGASGVLKEVSYRTPPTVDAGAGGDQPLVNKSEPTPATEVDGTKARFTLTQQNDLRGQPAGVADFFFLPKAISGDNYRFLIRVVRTGDQDIRDTVENGAQVEVLDDDGQKIPAPRGYLTGRFVIWRKVTFRLVILANRSAKTDVQWAAIQSRYRQDFLELDVPDSAFVQLRRDDWQAMLAAEFPGHAAFGNAANFNEASYTQGIFPAPMRNTTDATYDHMNSLVQRIITQVCTNRVNMIDPRTDPGQSGPEGNAGFHVVLNKFVRFAQPGGVVAGTFNPPAGGAHLGDRSFWFELAGDTHETVAHEFGHALSLRHNFSPFNRVTATYTPAAGANVNILLLDPLEQAFQGQRNSFSEDHDMTDAFNCLMGYVHGTASPLCGVCGLIVRFYDREQVKSQYGNQMAAPLAALEIVEVRPPAGTPTLLANITPMRVAGPRNVIDFMAVSHEYAIPGANPPPDKGRVDVSRYPSPPQSAWSAAPAGILTFSVVNNLVRATAGNPPAGVALPQVVTVTFSHRGMTATRNIEVRP